MAVSLKKSLSHRELTAVLLPLLYIGAAFDIALPIGSTFARVYHNGGDFVYFVTFGNLTTRATRAELEAA